MLKKLLLVLACLGMVAATYQGLEGRRQIRTPQPVSTSDTQGVEKSTSEGIQSPRKLQNNHPVPIGKPANLQLPSGQSVPNQRYRALLTPNDTIYPQWYTDKISAPAAWDITTGSSSVTIAIMDTGYALNHEDMAGRWAENSSEGGVGCIDAAVLCSTLRTNGLDDDANGYADDWRGWDFANSVAGDNDPIAGSVNLNGAFVTHGTVTSGLLGATGNNGKGTAAINWGAKILPLQVLDDDGIGYTSDIASALDYAVSRGAKVISLSLGADGTDPYLQGRIDAAIAAGVTIVAAAGHCGGSNYAELGCPSQGAMAFPASYAPVIAVGATDASDARAPFSSWGANVDVMAPGTGNIRSTFWSSSNQTSLYTTSANGTSISTPIVAGLAALVLSTNPSAGPGEIDDFIKNSSDPLQGMGGKSHTPYYGYGRINSHQALRVAAGDTAVYRLYQPGAKRHFFTTSTEERNIVTEKINFIYEGIGFWSCSQSEPNSSPIYRLFHTGARKHFFTSNTEERDFVVNTVGYTLEGVMGYACDSSGEPVYRLYSSSSKNHIYTKSAYERDIIVSALGFDFEGVAFTSK